MSDLRALKRRIIDISYRKQLSHIGSCLTAVGIIDEIYSMMKPGDRFCLSSGHAGLALYCVLEKRRGKDAEVLFDKQGVHPNRDLEDGIECSAGSLGQGLPIALGMALADPKHDVFCLISDGECAEGSIWEALSIAEKERVHNLYIYVNINGWGAYGEIDESTLQAKLSTFEMRNMGKNTIKFRHTYLDETLPFLEGQAGHYAKLSKEDYEYALNKFK